ncbi:hypothetical protein LaPh949_gp039 [Lactococcus phage 949]|uniref:Uncharacterized protein n=1 Tax=Lactococcus phage 949 TaxID=881953 RepID=E0YIS6_9CAUD|nr:hypothetical protein LaPh949_gp039 [Lactococcus phage 949]ADM73597.1 hypothetical protein [Lactococcus phage 949]
MVGFLKIIIQDIARKIFSKIYFKIKKNFQTKFSENFSKYITYILHIYCGGFLDFYIQDRTIKIFSKKYLKLRKILGHFLEIFFLGFLGILWGFSSFFLLFFCFSTI